MSSIDLDALRKELAEGSGPEYWRSLDELATSDRFVQYVEHEFGVSGIGGGVERRRFLQLMGASIALAGVGGVACTRQPEEKLVPFVKSPENVIPGKPMFYATAMQLGAAGVGLIAESHTGRPTRLDGNPDYPSVQGASDVFMQAAVLGLYDPDRSKATLYRGRITPHEKFLAALKVQLERPDQGEGVRILTESVVSPTVGRLLKEYLKQNPKAVWHQYDSVILDPARRGTEMTFGRPVVPHYDLSKADVILSVDADILGRGPSKLRHAREFAAGRRVESTDGKMNRLYSIEATPTVTGAAADHRLRVRTSDVGEIIGFIGNRLGLPFGPKSDLLTEEKKPLKKWAMEVAEELKSSGPRAVVIAGDDQPGEVHALVHSINWVLKNQGGIVTYAENPEVRPVSHIESITTLTEAMERGAVSTLLILGGNPVYTVPADLEFEQRLTKVPFKVHLGTHKDETARLCDWHVPQTHFLEEWGDLRGIDGTATIVQPLIKPLYKGRSILEIVNVMLGRMEEDPLEVVKATWGLDPLAWRRALHDGVVAGSTFKPLNLEINKRWTFGTVLGRDRVKPLAPGELELNFRPDPTLWDGSFANNGWLQETPKPLTKLTWDNALLIGPASAAERSLENEDLVLLTVDGRSLTLPVWIVPGQADNALTLYLGGGRTYGGQVSKSVGFNAGLVRSSSAPHVTGTVTLKKLNARHPLACTQLHSNMEGRDIIRAGLVDQYKSNPELFVGEHDGMNDRSLYPDYEYNGYAWGMNIDLNACIGCNACTVACQSENNIAVVGKEEVIKGRELHWIRVDHYFSESVDNPKTDHQPVPCMQCENAPCEVVCPATATVHSSEGLNDMVYNRCIGTRYCANNCPYKVRRFNFFLYSDFETESLKMQRNPDVTVRSRGVMEKCTYCVQRINSARITAKREGRQIKDGEVKTACQVVCPTQAITFGDINDKSSEVAKQKSSPRRYSLLGEIGTRPRTTYSGKLRNPNPDLDPV